MNLRSEIFLIFFCDIDSSSRVEYIMLEIKMLQITETKKNIIIKSFLTIAAYSTIVGHIFSIFVIVFASESTTVKLITLEYV